MLFILIIIALSDVLYMEMIWSVCKENSLLPSRFSMLIDRYGHLKMAKKQKMVLQKKYIILQRGGKESCYRT